MSTLIIIGCLVTGAIIGVVIAKILEKNSGSALINNAKSEAASLLKEAKSEAEALKKDKILQAKEKFIELKAEHEQVILSRDKKTEEAEQRNLYKQSEVTSELANNTKLNDQIEAKVPDSPHRLEALEKKQEEIDKMHNRQVEQLEMIGGLS